VLVADEGYASISSYTFTLTLTLILILTLNQSQILIDDGLISLSVIEKQGGNVRCKINNGGSLGARKGVNLPGVCVCVCLCACV